MFDLSLRQVGDQVTCGINVVFDETNVKTKLAQKESLVPIIRVDILEGRPEATKQALAERLTQTLSDVLGSPPEATHVIIEEHDKRHWSVGGVRYIDK